MASAAREKGALSSRQAGMRLRLPCVTGAAGLGVQRGSDAVWRCSLDEGAAAAADFMELIRHSSSLVIGVVTDWS